MIKRAQHVEFMARLPYSVQHRKKWVVACCPILDVHSQGKSEEEAVKNLTEALSLFFLSCFERGILDEVLKESGFSTPITKDISKIKPAAEKQQPPTIDVPIPFLVHQAPRTPCHA